METPIIPKESVNISEETTGDLGIPVPQEQTETAQDIQPVWAQEKPPEVTLNMFEQLTNSITTITGKIMSNFFQTIIIAGAENVAKSYAGEIVALASVPANDQADATLALQNLITAFQTKENIGQIFEQNAPLAIDVLNNAIAGFGTGQLTEAQNDERLGLIALKGAISELDTALNPPQVQVQVQ